MTDVELDVKQETAVEEHQLTLKDICDLRSSKLFQQKQSTPTDASETVVGLVLLYASWNSRNQWRKGEKLWLIELVGAATEGLDCKRFVSSIQVDTDEDSLGYCIGDSENEHKLPLPPEDLPTLALVAQNSSMGYSVLRYVPIVRSKGIVRALEEPSSFDGLNISTAVRKTLEDLETLVDIDVKDSSGALRIFVAGDRSSVGKSSVCLGILGNLLSMGYAASELAYIKPATQSESKQLIQVYCQAEGITCVPIGPLVYYRGFTRAFLAGETETTEELLAKCGRAVDRVARGKRVVLIDGVGFPAVGSICGTDNVSVARACSYPQADNVGDRTTLGVVLVGGSGVGGAVDAFNLNATYFDQADVPVLGAIFNKLSMEGFYSLENCRQQVTLYFDQSDEQRSKGRRPFGFVPLFPEIAGSAGMDHVEEYFRVFGSHVDVQAIVEAATRVKERPDTTSSTIANSQVRPVKRQKNAAVPVRTTRSRTRDEIEAQAIQAGAAPSA